MEGVYNSNLTLLETYHHFGSVLAQHERTYGDGFTKRVSKDLGKSQSTVQKCTRFATLYPDIQTLLDQYDKTLTWRRVANEILIEKKEEPKLISEPVRDIASCIRANLKFLIETAQVKLTEFIYSCQKICANYLLTIIEICYILNLIII